MSTSPRGAPDGARVLLVDDDAELLDAAEIVLEREGFRVERCDSGRSALERLDAGLRPDLVIAEVLLPVVSGLEVMQAVRRIDREIPVILTSFPTAFPSAIQAVRDGAFFALEKPFSHDDLAAISRRASEARRLITENRLLRKAVASRPPEGLERPIGRSPSFQNALRVVETVAATDSTLLVQGESGTGKGVMARYLHALSRRAEGPFVAVNCAALSEAAIEAELFGFRKGAFGSATRDHPGALVAASGGTLYLDEIAELAPSMQVKLLRVLQEGEVRPVGGVQSVPFELRLIVSTTHDLEAEAERGAFRLDLFYRIDVVSLRLPPLRDRRDDIVLLSEWILSRSGHDVSLSTDARSMLERYDWPGNVRELEGALERALALTSTAVIEVDAFPDRIREARSRPLVSDRLAANPSLDTIERAYINWVLEAEGGNKSRAAEVLGIDPSTLHRKLTRYSVQ